MAGRWARGLTRLYSTENKKIAITGSSGIIGSRLHQALADNGYAIVGVGNGQPSQGGPGRDQAAESHNELIDINVDLRSPACVDSGMFDGCSYVIHLAAEGSPGASFDVVRQSNIDATFHVMEAAKRAGVKRVVLCSTNHVQHGSSKAVDGGPGSIDRSRLSRRMRLSDIPIPDSFYGASKLHNEELGKLYGRVWKDFEVVALRIGWVLFDDPRELAGTEFEEFLRAMYLSRRDCIGFFTAAIEAPLAPEDEGFALAYAVSNNSTRVFSLSETIAKLGYSPQDSADTFFETERS